MKRMLKIILIVLGVVIVLLAIVPFLIPVPPLENVVPPEKLADADSRFINIHGINVHYKMFGQGKPVFILLHGFAASEFSWREVMQPLAQEYNATVIAYDRPAFGLTARPLPGEWTGDSPYGPDAQVNMLIGLMDALKIERAIWVGNSAGGGIAALAALRHPSRVDALILVDAAIGGGSNAPWYQPLMTTPQGRRIGPLIARQIKEWGIDFGKSAWHAPSKITPEIWQGYLKPLQVENWDRALWEFTASSRPTELASQIKNITLPTLVITGDDDKIVPKERSIRLANELPNAKLVVIPNCGHVPHEECPAEFLSAVKNFMGTMR